MHSVPHKGGSRSPEKEKDGAQTELVLLSQKAAGDRS